MDSAPDLKNPISPDAPQTNIADDAFGYSPFAKRLAAGVQNTPSPNGLVMAIHGSWGSGKTTLLNFIKQWLDASPNESPVVIDFNPWWFNGHEQLAAQFLAQFWARLPRESEALRKAGDAIAKYSNELGKVVTAAYSLPVPPAVWSWLLRQLGRKPKDVPTLKAEIATALLKSGRRFLFVVDDIDRLTPREIVETFKVIKAIADFPNVVYLLAFDRTVVANALGTALGVDGESFLEKIVQAPFSLPAVDRLQLQWRLFDELNKILAGTDDSLFDSTHWGNVFHDGLSQLIVKPRDIVRVINALSVTYPAVRGEVNGVDFVALEFLRVFVPVAYAAIRDHRDRFAGHSDSRHSDQKELLTFHDQWLAQLPEHQRAGIRAMVQRLFPKLLGVWGNNHHGSDFLKRWRRQRNVCSPDVFPIYFQFGVSSDKLSRQELSALIELGGNVEDICTELLAAAAVKRPDGSTKASEFLAQLTDFEGELPDVFAAAALTAIFRVGDRLVLPSEQLGGMVSIPGNLRILWLVEYLLARSPQHDREQHLVELVTDAEAVGTAATIVNYAGEFAKKAAEVPRDNAFVNFSSATLATLQNAAAQNIGKLAESGQLLTNPDLATILQCWKEWAPAETVRSWFLPIMENESTLLLLLERHLQYGSSHGWGDRVARRIPSFNPRVFEPFVDLEQLEAKVKILAARNDLAGEGKTAVHAFLRSMERIRKGQNPLFSFGSEALDK